MLEASAPRPRRSSRRRFLGLAALAVGLVTWERARVWSGPAADPGPARDPAAPEDAHRLVLKLPAITSNGAKVPIVVTMAHPMESDHHITNIHVLNARDPVPSKGVFHFTPRNGQAHVAYQARLDEGVSRVTATAECNRHRRWSVSGTVTIPEGAGGCAGTAGPAPRVTNDEIRPPIIRVPQLVGEGHLTPDQIIDVQLKIKHPNRTGLVVRDGVFVQESDPFHLERMEVFDGAELVSRFAMTSALSDNPFITFKLRLRQEGLLRIVLTNNRGQRFEATHPIRFG